LKKNEIGLQGIKTLEDCLSLSKTIKELNISGNNIGDEGLEIVIRALSNKKRQSLTILSLSSNKITSKGCKMICDFILKGNNLEELHLSNNEIDNDGAQHLIKVLSGKNRFSVIDIDNNKISGEALMQLFNIMPLRNLNLIKNVLSDQ
jgi:Ran GTPase-activating protein (RanGAP) involved in mRNA processing and transport